MIRKYFIFTHIICCTIFVISVVPGFAQEPRIQREVSILESRFSTTTSIVGDSFRYFLKFDYEKDLKVSPVEFFDENGISIIERKQLELQEFEGRIIEQYEYTLRAEKEGQYQFSPAALHYAGPLKKPAAGMADPVQLTILPVVDVQVVTNSPIMIDEPLELSLAITKRKPVTITSMPHEFDAIVQIPEEPKPREQEPITETQAASATPTPPPAPLHFALDQSQNIVPQQADGQTVEPYKYILAAAPEQAGEYVIPEFTVTYRSAAGEEIQKHVETTSIFVLNPNTGNVDVRTDYRFLILPAIVAAALLLGGVLVFVYLKYRKPRKKGELDLEWILPPGELAYKEFAEIQAMKLPNKGEFKKYYFLLSESVRKFLGAEYRFHVLERTTEEILGEIQQQDIPEKVRRRINTFLPEADLVKFAKYIPSLEETDNAMEQALKIVDESLEYHRPKIINEEPELAARVKEG